MLIILRHLHRVAVLTVSFASVCTNRAQTSSAPAAPASESPAIGLLAAPKAPASASLKEAAKGRLYIGVAIRPDQVNGQNSAAAELITRDFSSITAENAMKMGPIHPRPGNEPGSYNFERADQIVEFGVKHHLVIIGHNLCWHSQMPAWMGQPDPGQEILTKEVLLARLRDHIMTVAGRYKGKIHGWDVVNEAINDGEGGYRQSVFYRVIGKEYLALAFKWAHEADPEAELYYNDYNLDANDQKRATAVELIKYLREQGAVVHGIGMQGHYNMNGPSIAKIDETIQIFSDLGLKVHITELDVRATTNAALTGEVGAPPPAVNPAGGPPNAATPGGRAGGRGGRGPVGPPPPLTEAQQQALARRYSQIFQVFLKHPAVVRVTFWGLRDADSWRRPDSPLIFDDAYGRKPAYDAVIHALMGSQTSR